MAFVDFICFGCFCLVRVVVVGSGWFLLILDSFGWQRKDTTSKMILIHESAGSLSLAVVGDSSRAFTAVSEG